MLEDATAEDFLDTDPRAVRNAVLLRPDLHQLPVQLRAFLEEQGPVGEAESSDRGNVHIALSGVILSWLPWDEEDIYMETVRANPDFHGRAFYDCVC